MAEETTQPQEAAEGSEPTADADARIADFHALRDREKAGGTLTEEERARLEGYREGGRKLHAALAAAQGISEGELTRQLVAETRDIVRQALFPDTEYRHRSVCLERVNGRFFLAVKYEGTLFRRQVEVIDGPSGRMWLETGEEVPGSRTPTSGVFFQGPATPQLTDLGSFILQALARYEPLAADEFFCRDAGIEAELRAYLAGAGWCQAKPCREPQLQEADRCEDCPHGTSGEQLAKRITPGPPPWPLHLPDPNPDAWPWCEPAEEDLTPELRETYAGLLQPGYSQREWLASLKAPKHTRARPGPAKIPQPTFPEVAAQMRALADGPSGRNYEEIAAEEALLHRTPGHRVVTKVTPGPLLDWFHRPATRDALRQELREAGLPAAFQLAVVVGWGLQDKKSLIRRPLDDIAMTVKGRRARSQQERLAWRREVWRYLLLGQSLTNPEARPGKFKDPETGAVIDTIAREALYRVFGEEWPAQRALDDSEPPLAVTVGLNPDIDNLVNRDDVLTFFGDVMLLAPIPDGQASSRWARAMGLALNQLFRQRQRAARVKRQGDANLPAVPFTFTRKEVLVYVAGEVEVLLAGNDPSRAREYWQGAVDLLLPPKSARDKKRAGVLAVTPHELTPLPGGRRTWEDWRQHWQQFWYEEQRLEFRPGAEGVKALLAMKASAKRQRK